MLAAKTLLGELCSLHGIPESHGFGYAARVLAHAECAIRAAAVKLDASRCLAVRLAALLHDADDRKYFPDGPAAGYRNARRISEMAGATSHVVDEVAYMISLVSTNSNGNSIPARAVCEPELLWPRWADRLEAIGERGVVRCWQYSHEVEQPIFDLSTPRPLCEADVWEEAKPENLEAYQSKRRVSCTMLDHYYLALLPVSRPPMDALCSPYFEEEFAKGRAALVEICLEFGAKGNLDEDRIRRMRLRLDDEED
jgi:uncharacterized protein